MFQHSLNLDILTLDLEKYKKALDKAIQTQVRQAAREWLRAVIIHVPVWTGTARGTLIPLGQFLKVAIPIQPIKTRSGMGPHIGATQGFFEFKDDNFLYTFIVDTTLPHYLFNELHDAQAVGFNLTHPTPWFSYEAGEEAFNEYLERNLERKVPRIDDYIITKKMKN